jgi:hypothetical protein
VEYKTCEALFSPYDTKALYGLHYLLNQKYVNQEIKNAKVTSKLKFTLLFPFSALIYHARGVLEKLKARFDNVLYAAKDYRVSFSDRCMLRVLN